MSDTRRHRLFFALNPPGAVRDEVFAVQRSLALEARPVPPANFHVTLAFLGMQPARVIADARGAAARLAMPRCEVVLDHIGRFQQAGVLWLGASEVPSALRDFQRDLVGALLEAGIGYDRKPWKFHLTLYRKMRTASPKLDPVAIRWCPDGFSLVESFSVRSGVEYHDVGYWKTAG